MAKVKHWHHIIPEHMGGTDDPDNLVHVTVEKHAELHKQLWEDLGHEQDRIAWKFLSGQINLDEAKYQAIVLAGQTNKGKKIITKDGVEKRVYPEQVQEYIENGWKLGRAFVYRHTEEIKKHLSKTQTGKVYSVETLEKMRKAKLGKKASEETKRKMTEAHIKRLRKNV